MRSLNPASEQSENLSTARAGVHDAVDAVLSAGAGPFRGFKMATAALRLGLVAWRGGAVFARRYPVAAVLIGAGVLAALVFWPRQVREKVGLPQ
jgi:hypothetical protein